MVKIIPGEAGDFADYCILPRKTTKGCTVTTVDLDTMLGPIHLGLPLISAAMTSVTGYEMALALGKEGGLGVLPVRMEMQDKLEAIGKIKNYGINFVEKPIKANQSDNLETVITLAERHGHSKIPIVNDNSQFMGLFDMDLYLERNNNLESDRVDAYMLPYKEILRVRNPSLTTTEALVLLDEKKRDYMVIMEEHKHLVKLFFRKDANPIPVAAAISSHKGWVEDVEALANAGVDMISVDSSDCYNEHVEDLIKAYKAMAQTKGIPLCVGNVVTYEGVFDLMEWGADIVKIGMATGSICTTMEVKGVGRPIMAALLDAGKARSAYFKKAKRYVPIIVDGGVRGTASLNKALTEADAVMMGSYFNQFYEAAGQKCDVNKKIIDPVAHEHDIRYVVTYGEGSDFAKSLGRYGHDRFKTFFTEGVYGHTPYRGRLKPCINTDMKVLRAAMVNVGAMTLPEYREKARMQKMSIAGESIAAHSHDVEVQK